MSKIRNYGIAITAFVLSTLLTAGFSSCSSDDGDSAEMSLAARKIEGKWKLVSRGSVGNTSEQTYITFDANKKVTYEYNIGQDTHYTTTSAYSLADNWNYNGAGELNGNFRMNLSTIQSKEENYSCCFKEDYTKIVLLPDMGYNCIVNPTMYFVKITAGMEGE